MNEEIILKEENEKVVDSYVIKEALIKLVMTKRIGK